jgi:hypothetical protein
MANRVTQRTDRRGSKTVLPYEAEARAIEEKTARLKALRLARDAAEAASAPPPVVRTVASRKSAKKAAAGSAASLSEWLATQQKEGRRS